MHLIICTIVTINTPNKLIYSITKPQKSPIANQKQERRPKTKDSNQKTRATVTKQHQDTTIPKTSAPPATFSFTKTNQYIATCK